MNIIVVGLNHKTAPVEIREKLSFQPQVLEYAHRRLLQTRGVTEGMILSTCNRVEVYTCVEDPEGGIRDVKGFLSAFHNLPLERFEEHLFACSSEGAMRHLFRVASSLDSMVVGEPQILGQLKDAYHNACKYNTAGVILNKLLHRAFSTAKRVRTETKIANSAVSISYAAVELAKKIFGSLEGKVAMLVGAGEMCELAAKHFMNSGINEIYITNRTYERAVNLAKEFNGTPVQFNEFHHTLPKVDIVLSSTGAPHYIIKPEDVTEALRARKQKPMFFIDIAVPRDIDPKVNDIDNVYLYDIDDMQGVIEANVKERAREAERAEGIISEDLRGFVHWLKTLDLNPTIVGMRERAEEIRRKEMEKALSYLKDVSPEQMKVLESMTSAIVNKLLHHPIAALKTHAKDRYRDMYLEAARNMFNLAEKEKEETEELEE
jgi:glutamyl-tRNA reductase